MSQRVSKVNELIQQEVSTYIQENLGRHLGIMTITIVETTPDLKHAKIWFGYIGHDLGSAIKELKSSQRSIQKYLNDKLTMKSIPRISFALDNSGDYAQKISKIIDESR